MAENTVYGAGEAEELGGVDGDGRITGERAEGWRRGPRIVRAKFMELLVRQPGALALPQDFGGPPDVAQIETGGSQQTEFLS